MIMEIRVRADDTVEVSGYVNAVGRESRPMRDADGYFTETIAPGAFARALSKDGDRRLLLNHDAGRELGKESAGLELFEDAVGLFARATVGDPEVAAKARAGKLRGWSFGFRNPEQFTEERAGMRHRTVTGMDLVEVSIIDDSKLPCYEATSVFTRASGDGSPDVEIRAMEAQSVSVEAEEPAPPAPEGPNPMWGERIRELLGR